MQNPNFKVVRSPDYSYIFDRETGSFARWGKTEEDDPPMSPLGPEIADIEVSTICCQGCRFCYKDNTPCGKNMSFSQFVSIFHKLCGHQKEIRLADGSVKRFFFHERVKLTNGQSKLAKDILPGDDLDL